jgi:hypothetical protein
VVDGADATVYVDILELNMVVVPIEGKGIDESALS